jgi:DNA polymerase III subunit delta'
MTMAFADVVGHQRPLRILRRLIETGRVHHAYLFTGMEGIGKRLVALNMAKALNCADQAGEACDRCRSCQLIAKGVHPDVILINPTGESIKIEQIRELERSVAFKPYEARWRVVLIDRAEQLTREAANALLKTLEEPPSWTMIILLATAIEGLPATVPSRCQRIRFSPLSHEEVKKVLADRLSAEEITILAPLAGGSPGRALQMDAEEIKKVKGLLVSAFSPSLNRRLQIARDLAHEEERGKLFLEILGGWLRDLIIYQETRAEQMLLNRDLHAEIKKVVTGRQTAGLLRDFWSLHEIQQGIEAHGNLQLSLESALLGIGGS